MAKITDKIKEKVKDVKDKVVETKDKVTDTTKDTLTDTRSAGTRASTTTDSSKQYESKEPMSPAKLKEQEPSAVKREMTEKITEVGKTSTDSEKTKELARKSGMTKGTAGTEETSNEFE